MKTVRNSRNQNSNTSGKTECQLESIKGQIRGRVDLTAREIDLLCESMILNINTDMDLAVEGNPPAKVADMWEASKGEMIHVESDAQWKQIKADHDIRANLLRRFAKLLPVQEVAHA